MFIAEEPAPEPHLAHPEVCAALRIGLVNVPRVSRSCEHFPDGFDLHLLARSVTGTQSEVTCNPERRLYTTFRATSLGAPLQLQLRWGCREIGFSLPNKQRQHRTLHTQKDLLPYAVC